MKQFLSEIGQENGVKIITLMDQKNSVRAKILPDLGNNLVSLSIDQGEKARELIWIPTEIGKLKESSFQFYGNPLLFPFPGRIPKGIFTFQDQDYQMPVNFRDGTAIHGLVFDKKWQVKEISEPSDNEVFVKSIYHSNEEIERFFPFPFQVEMIYLLRESELELTFKATNLGTNAFPFGYGIHPYFKLTGKREDWHLCLPAAQIYELRDILPTGRTNKISTRFDFRKEKSLNDIFMDDLFGKIKKNRNGFVSCLLRNPLNKANITVLSDQTFDYYVLYAPKEYPFICIEPYTCIPNAYNLANQGIETGLRFLRPQETFGAKIVFKWGL